MTIASVGRVGLSDAALTQHFPRRVHSVRSFARDGRLSIWIYYTLASGDVRAVLETLDQRFYKNRPRTVRVELSVQH